MTLAVQLRLPSISIAGRQQLKRIDYTLRFPQCPLRLCGPTQFGRARALPCYGAPMRGFGLSRWQQIATVLSILWAIGAWFYTINSFERDAELISERMYDDCVVHRS